MGFRLSFGVGPLRYSKSLSGHRRRGQPGCIASLVMMVFYLILACAWLVWAVIMLPAAGIAKLARNDNLCRRMISTLHWSVLSGRR
jgi:hypothetical protein